MIARSPVAARASLVLAAALLSALPASAEPKWEVKSKSDSLTIYNREKPGSDLKEVKAVGVIKAPPWVCFNVVSDEGRFKEFMPYTAESKVLQTRKDGSEVVYQRLDTPFVDDRDYTMIIRDESKRLPDGRIIYKKTWKSANSLGPPPKEDVVRVQHNEGYWTFEELDGGKHTKATYYLFTDPGGSLPSFIVNGANGQAVPGVFEAVEKQAQTERYRKSRPAVKDAVPEPAAAATVSAP